MCDVSVIASRPGEVGSLYKVRMFCDKMQYVCKACRKYFQTGLIQRRKYSQRPNKPLYL